MKNWLSDGFASVAPPSTSRRGRRRNARLCRWLAIGGAVGTLWSVPLAWADDSVDTLAGRALAHADRGDWVAAEPLIREAVAREGTEQQRYQLARVLAHLNQVVEATAVAQSIAEDPNGDLLFRDAARALVGELRSRIATLVVRPPRSRRPVSLAIDGQEVSLRRARLGVSVDPGIHRLEARDERGAVVGAQEALLVDGERLELSLAAFLRPVEDSTRDSLPEVTGADEPGGVALGWWLGLGGAAALGAIVLAAVLLSGEEQPTAGDVPAVTIGGGE